MRSNMIKKGDHQVPARSLLHATDALKGPTDMNKPFVAICNSHVDIVPRHVHSRELADIAKEAVREAGAIPFEFNTIGVDDGIATGHIGMRYSLPLREIITDAAETVINVRWFDGVFYIPGCGKIAPSMILAAVKTNMPIIFCSGGPIKTDLSTHGKALIPSSVFETAGAFKEGSISKGESLDMEQNACPTYGSCAGIFTANSMNYLVEVLDLALLYNGTALAIGDQRREVIRQTTFKLVENIKNDLKPRDIVTRGAIDDIFALDMAMSSSTNTVLHTLTIANETGIDYDLEHINTIAKCTPYLSKIAPSSSYSVHDVHKAGGVPAIINELTKKDGTLHPDRITVTGKTLHENSEGGEIKNFDVIHSLDTPYGARGGLSILFGDIASKGAVIKVGDVDPSIRAFTGRAICFDSRNEAVEAVDNRTVRAGHVVVVRYEGPKGGPGVPEMLAPTSSIIGRGLGKDVALTTDGCSSDATRGITVSRISPEATPGGPITLTEDGSEITIDLTNRILKVNQPEDVLACRQESLTPFKAKVRTGYLARYTALVTSADTGGVMQVPENLI